MQKIIYIILISFSATLYSQNSPLPSVTFSGYGEMYLSSNFIKNTSRENANFIYNYKRLGEINLNMALAKANYTTQNTRANLALMLGNYPQYNMSGEPNWAQNIYEANIGIKLSKSQNLWLDAGIMPSHLGFESAIGADNLTLTRSILAENSPYFETGAKLSFTNKNDKLYLSIMYLNGWQRIRKPDNIHTPSFGAQITYKPLPELTLNYGNFIGTDTPDSLQSTRIFHNLYAQYSPTKKLDVTLGFDIGTQKNIHKNTAIWYSPILISRYHLNEKKKIAARIEYYQDAQQTIISTGTPYGFQTYGYSINYDYFVSKNISLRTEIKKLQSKDAIFTTNPSPKNQQLLATMALTIKL